jgi:hypothetical protein
MASRNAQKSQDRRARAEELRKKQQAQARRSKVYLYGGSFAVALIVIIGLVLAYQHNNKQVDAKGPEVLPLAVTAGVTTKQKPVVVVTDSSGIPGEVAYDSSGYPTGKAGSNAMVHDHVVGPVTYSITPPVGGPHNGTWMNCGIYTKPVASERAVHDLEHGAVWITYRPSLSSSEVSSLTALVLKQSKIGSNRYVNLTPWATSEDLPSPIVISSWGHQLKVETASDPRLQTFIDDFRAKKGVTPELGSACDGIPVSEGGRPAVS